MEPTDNVWDEVDRAARVWHELRGRGREIDFALGEDGSLAITLRDLSGNALRSLSPSETLALASGA